MKSSTDQEKDRAGGQTAVGGDRGKMPNREGSAGDTGPDRQDVRGRFTAVCEEDAGESSVVRRLHVESRGYGRLKRISRSILPVSIICFLFYGKAHIAYIPDGKVVGLSKLARTVEVFARRLQLQEQLTGQIADALMEYMQPKGALVMIEAEHMCMTMRGIKKPGSQTVTLARRGVFETDPSLEERFFRMLGR